MMNPVFLPLYAQDALREVTGDTVRPGGLNLTQRGIDFCSLPEDAMILDVACGTGVSVQWLTQKNGYHVVGVDASMFMLQEGRQRLRTLPLVLGKSGTLPFAGGKLAAVLVECSLSLMPDMASVLQEIHRVLHPSGILIASDLFLTNPQGVGLLRSLPVECCLKGAKSQAELFETVQGEHFEIILWEDHSESLKHLSSQLILAHGSMQQFWLKTTYCNADLFELQLAISRAKPGYYLLVARKTIDAPQAS